MILFAVIVGFVGKDRAGLDNALYGLKDTALRLLQIVGDGIAFGKAAAKHKDDVDCHHARETRLPLFLGPLNTNSG